MKFLKELKLKLENIYAQTTAILRIVVNFDSKLDRLALKSTQNEDKSMQKADNLLMIARHTLGSIDLKDISDPDEMDEASYNEHLARVVQLYEVFEKEARWIMKLQHDFWFTNSNSWEQTMFGRGTSNGIQLILDRFQLLKDKHLQKTTKVEEPPIGSREDILARLQVEGSSNLADEMANKEQ